APERADRSRGGSTARHPRSRPSARRSPRSPRPHPRPPSAPATTHPAAESCRTPHTPNCTDTTAPTRPTTETAHDEQASASRCTSRLGPPVVRERASGGPGQDLERDPKRQLVDVADQARVHAAQAGNGREPLGHEAVKGLYRR